MKRKIVVATAALGLSIGLVSQPAGAGKARVKATSERRWSPDFKHIEPGTRLIWKNPTGAEHTVTAYGGGWSKNATLAPGTSTRKRFRNEGTYRYRCTNHSTMVAGECDGMCGVIHVAN